MARSTAARQRTFIDTNVLVYAHDASDPRKHAVARDLVSELWADRSGVVSSQVLQELYVVMTRKLDPPMSRSEARELVALYATWHLVAVDAELILDAALLEDRQGFSFWDALIVEAARRAGAARLVSEDLRNGRDLDGVAVENPFGSE